METPPTKPNGDEANVSHASIAVSSKDSLHHQYHPLAPSSTWQIGLWSRFPWAPFLALFVTFLAATVVGVILHISDGTEVSAWKLSPAVYLAIASAVANILLHFAINRGTEVAFWVKALKPRTTVRDLHNYWSFGTSLKSTLLSGRSFNSVALAGIALALVPLNGPLL